VFTLIFLSGEDLNELRSFDHEFPNLFFVNIGWHMTSSTYLLELSKIQATGEEEE
jgi:hypothetical protein